MSLAACIALSLISVVPVPSPPTGLIPLPEPITITIRGWRGQGPLGQRRIVVKGRVDAPGATPGALVGARVQPRYRLIGVSGFLPGTARPIDAEGRFHWRLRTNHAVEVRVVFAGSRSNVITLPERPGRR